MSEPKFTPKPWHVEDNGLCVCDSNRVVLFMSDRPYGDETDRADIHLATTAPEMYDFINYFLTIGGQSVLRLLPYDIARKIFDEAVRIIRKARGESEVSE